jgi:hypothetical protein
MAQAFDFNGVHGRWLILQKMAAFFAPGDTNRLAGTHAA